MLFSQRVNVSSYSDLFLEIRVLSAQGRPLSIDNQGEVSARTYIEGSDGVYRSVNFDMNQRLLVANQEEAFSYRVPNRVTASRRNSVSSKLRLGSLSYGYIIALFLFSLVRRRVSLMVGT